MGNLIKDYIKTKPRLYDLCISLTQISNPVSAWLDNFSRSFGRPITFIQVGASDGLRWDPVRRFIVRDQWCGIFVEPLPPVYRMLINNYSYLRRSCLNFENCAVSSGNQKSIKIWTFSERFLADKSVEEKMYYLRKSSLNKDQLKKYIGVGVDFNSVIQSYEVPCKELSEIISFYFNKKDLDLIFIDAEGRDDDVIKSIDFEACQPSAILYEKHNMEERNKSLEEYLVSMNYDIVDLGGDAAAVRRLA